MKIKFCGAAGTVTGSCHMVITEKTSFLVDCGMFQGPRSIRELNYGEFLFNPQDIDFIILTHAHVDHCGLIPKLFKQGFKGTIYTTRATKELCRVVLPDSGYIQEMEVERKNRKFARKGEPFIEPIYTAADAEACLPYFKGYSFKEPIEITPDIKVVFREAGHILGSAIVEVFINENEKEEKIVFSGDLGNTNQPILKDPVQIKEADIVVMESTYGNRLHKEIEEKDKKLAEIIKDTHRKGGNLVIPSFAVERTQDLIYNLIVMQKKGLIPVLDVFIDSPMAVEATKVFIRNPEFCDDEECKLMNLGSEAEELFTAPNIKYIVSTEESISLNSIKNGAIIISASGMADAGRIKHHLKHNLWRPESTILFVGYQAEGTLGRRILEGEKVVRIHGEEVFVKADIRNIDGYSAHADQNGLLNWISGYEKKPKKVFLVHGEEESLKELKKVIIGKTGLSVEIPAMGAEYDFSSDLLTESVVKDELISTSNGHGLEDSFKVIKDKIIELGKYPHNDQRVLHKLFWELDHIKQEIKQMQK